MFAQYRDTGLVRIRFDEFCHAMEAPPSCLKDFGQLRRRVIDPAVAELTGKDGLLIEWKPTKSGGRKVTGLEFTFQPNPNCFYSDGIGSCMTKWVNVRIGNGHYSSMRSVGHVS
ncbi:hypothetical protein PPGU19_026930 [Paraburkholderia sp. PGU19]|nr:hypothetical protein PPGU19_026930 [Paraburkholderia sp. PGU19]